MSTALRYSEYYGMQETFDWLYDRSKKRATNGLRLYEIITSRENILLAYRNIKANTGSKTKGTDGLTIADYKVKDEGTFVKEIRDTLKNYKPNSIRRVEIPKDNGKTRPLGIPTMRDRIIQQMFKQVLESICEARFHKHSYGFRPNRSTHHAMSRNQYLINIGKMHHVVDIDIKGFFDNVNHTKLLKQMYDIGIKDKRVLRIVSKMLKAPIEGIGIPTEGTPQGGILSPLLSNIVLNELDWWVSDQWETFETKYRYSRVDSKYLGLKKYSNLKEMFIVRYADDFKIYTRNHITANKIFHAIKNYLKNNLKLDISTEKSQITNLRKKSSDFLGFKIKVVKKRNKHVANTFVMEKKKEKIKSRLRDLILNIQKNPLTSTVNKYNIYIIGIKNYYKYATHINRDFSKIAYQISKTLFNRLKSIGKCEIPIKPNETYKKFNKNNFKTHKVAGLYLHPIADIQTKNVMNFSQNICNYTSQGRELIYKKLKPNVSTEIQRLMNNIYEYNTVELADNKLSKYSSQKGKCLVTGKFLCANEVEIHHIKPTELGGKDEFANLIAIHKDVHKLIHATLKETIDRYMNKLQLNVKQLKKVNKYRKECNLINLD
ncbi:group II intron reverse transcriptase/maturase [Crassaminicella indica]|uniref:Group II intron reverse transcriptase/maturase n=1 Tax=Crassaminicella indica TaxID=2855394 RepID=A0ABX8RA91_9CLOT|nr:group II intron reverse transcriptase/maturase [Crassaminicella indica]QXM05943.1 group II intron reverse transcriptase/maturase [Crassaminicella indica]QXM06191.1 group II intron reverse transcriptase/maturase [Crassaminicella indica]QXM07002.1 group II intron reverse transcriptase/maturase [Crassaminicella indica]QXM07108.1 group II intron reverse transcriptase/maturase [Crassaminicella indica]